MARLITSKPSLETPKSTGVETALTTEAACLNCGHALSGPFCSQCGQEAKEPVPRLRDLLGDVFEEFFKLDAKVFRTVKSLVLHPGQLTAEYANGRRADYVAPFKLYFTTSFLFYLMMQVSGDRDASSWGLSKLKGVSPQVIAAMEEGVKFGLENAAIVSILLLPLNAIILAGLFYLRKQPFILHLVATLHIWSGSVLLFVPSYALLEIAIKIAPSPALKAMMGPLYMVVIFGYQFFAFRRLFHASRLESFLKSATLSVWTFFLGFAVFFVFMIAFVVIGARKGTAEAIEGRTRHAKEQQISRGGDGRSDGPQRDRGLQQPRQ